MSEMEIAPKLGKQFRATPFPFVGKPAAKAGSIFALQQAQNMIGD